MLEYDAYKINIDFSKRHNSVRYCGRYENNKTARGKRARGKLKKVKMMNV